jgi:hypothetical protein
MQLRGELVAHKAGSSGAAVRIDGDSGRKITGASGEGQPITQAISAPPRENESNTSEVCQILRQRLNEERTAAKDQPWTDIEVFGSHNSDVDAVIYNKTEELAVQVTRPDLNGIWRKISTGVTVQTSHEIEQAADEIRHAIERKQLLPKPFRQTRLDQLRRKREQLQGKRSRLNGLVLAIDCVETPALVLNPAVAGCVDRACGAWARSIGFTAIWLVGSTAALTHRIE